MPSAGQRPIDPGILVVEAWGQGFLVGSLIIMIAITAANMKKGVPLHRLIVAELALALGHGTFIFLHAPAQGWYLSATAIGLTISHTLHNVIAWMKIRGYFTPWGTRLYLITLLAAQPYWVVEIYANFAFFNRGQALYTTTRPLEPLFQCGGPLVDLHHLLSPVHHPAGLWVFAGAVDSHQPTFGIMLLFMVISVVFAVVDMCAIRVENRLGYPPGMEPFWKLAFVFKRLSDTIILDDFRSALDRLRYHYHPDDVPPQEATHARGRSANRLARLYK
ncbi:hypothetical protein CBS63078_11349 [Aspergillus niger]|nr:hypothetical protein CBS13152_11428 [Aspergillus niger]KAI2868746.1 hypothetical protein CBS11852_11320 [Aspergillus niger]KAI2883982.1 hypothetical protein CBS63078_11349 [Aspergillus niger]KAI3014142.1 hypothetical protein CBS147347_11534 [Aspergillus niger]KAI3031475.1 hypothetical protein CBS76997_11443 [Aspergillus niger]